MMETDKAPAADGKPLTILLGANYMASQKAEFVYIALKRLGHTVIPFTPSQNAPEGWLKADPQVDAVELVKGCGGSPDMFLMVESRVGAPFLPKRIPDLEIPTGCWLFDNHLNFRWNKEAAALFDYGFFAQLSKLNLAARYGRNNLTWLPFAADEMFHRNFEVERDIDVGYVGSVIPQKQRYFDEFEKSGLKIVTNDEYLNYEDVGRFYSRCKLVYNISARRDLNPRTFEASMAGALVVNQGLVDEGCGRIFTEGENMVFHDFDDAPDICRELLADDRERERMASNAQRLVMSAHTYRHRMQKIIDTCAGGVTEERKKRRDSFLIHVTDAMTCQHPHFRWRGRAARSFRRALGKSIVKTAAYLVKYAWYRIIEKAEKIRWSLGKAPV